MHHSVSLLCLLCRSSLMFSIIVWLYHLFSPSLLFYVIWNTPFPNLQLSICNKSFLQSRFKSLHEKCTIFHSLKINVSNLMLWTTRLQNNSCATFVYMGRYICQVDGESDKWNRISVFSLHHPCSSSLMHHSGFLLHHLCRSSLMQILFIHLAWQFMKIDFTGLTGFVSW